jgi:hypothetical protein
VELRKLGAVEVVDTVHRSDRALECNPVAGVVTRMALVEVNDLVVRVVVGMCRWDAVGGRCWSVVHYCTIPSSTRAVERSCNRVVGTQAAPTGMQVVHILSMGVSPRPLHESNGQRLPCECRAIDSSIIWSKIDRALTKVSFMATKSARFKVQTKQNVVKKDVHLVFDCTCQ